MLANLEDISGSLTLKQAWPKIEANDQALNAELADHEARLTAIVSGDSGAAANEARLNGVTGATSSTLKVRLDIDYLAKADKTYVDTLVQSVANGSPKGVYANLEALQAAIPAGNTNIYLVQGNNGGVQEVETLNVTGAPTISGNITITLNGVATNVAVTIGTAEVASLSVTAGATASSNVTVTLNGVATNVAVLNGDTATDVATKIRAASFTGWTTGGSGTTVTFTATAVGVKTDATYSAGTTGATGTMSTTTQGVDADTTTTVATKIRGTVFSGWTTGGSGTTVTFTKTLVGPNTVPSFSAGTTGAAATMSVTTPGEVVRTGNWYYWNGSAWTDGGTYQGTGLVDGTVTIKNTNFLFPGKNLFDKSKATDGYLVGYSNGVVSANVDHSVSDYIKVSGDTPYVKNVNGHIAFYDSNKAFISGINGDSSAGVYFTTPFNCAYLKMSVKTYTTYKNTAQLEQGTSSTYFEDYTEMMLTTKQVPSLGTSKILDGAVTAAKVADGTLTVAKTAFLTPGKNLFDKSLATDNYLVGPTNGIISSNTDHSVSAFIKVLPSTTYIKNVNGHVAFYDSSQVFISGINGDASAGVPFTTPSNCAYLRFSVKGYAISKNTAQLELGSVVTAFEAFTDFTIDSLRIKDGAITQQKTSYLQASKNLYNKATATDGYLIDPNSGAVSANSDHSASAFIPISPSTTYIKNVQGHVAFYNSSQSFISGISEGTALANVSFTSPAGAYYMRFSIKSYATGAKKDIAQLELGTTATSYRSYGIYSVPTEMVPIGELLKTSEAKNQINLNASDIVFAGYKTLLNDPQLQSKGRAVGTGITMSRNNFTDSPQLSNNSFVQTTFNATASGNKGIIFDLDNPQYHLNANGHTAGQFLQFFCLINSNNTSNWDYWGPWLRNTSLVSKSMATFTDVGHGWYTASYSYQITQADLDGDMFIHEINFLTSKTDNTAIDLKIAVPTVFIADKLMNPMDVIKAMSTPKVTTKYSGKVWNSLGDSITAAATYQPLVVADLKLASYRNYGIGGTTLADNGSPDAFVNRYNAMDNAADIITVMGGTNDWGQNIPLGNDTEYTITTYKGALRTIIEGLIAKYPTGVIVFFTLPQRSNVTYPSGINANGNKTQDFADAVKKICAEYAIPVVDIHGMSGITKLTINTYTSDGVHPNAAGHRRMANLIVSTLNFI